DDEVRRLHHRVDRDVRPRAVAALALEGDLQAVRCRIDDTRLVEDVAVRPRPDMQREAVVGLGETLEQAVLDHVPGATAALLGRLADEHQRSAPLILRSSMVFATATHAAIWTSW